MTINVLICHPDGAQEIVERSVPDDYLDFPVRETTVQDAETTADE